MAALKMYWANILTGGAAGALDKIPAASWADKYGALVIASNYLYAYECDDDLGGTESSPFLIQPDDESGNLRLNLLGGVFEDIKTNDLRLYDTDASNVLSISWGEGDTSDRTLTINVGTGNRSITLNENFAIGDGTDITITGVTAARTITLNENFTVGNGTDITITGVTAARTFTMNENFTIGDGNDGILTFSASGDTLTVGESLTLDGASGKTLTLEENLTISDGADVTITSVTQANTLTLNEGFTIGDGNSGTLTYSAASKTLTVEDTTNVNQDLTSDASPTFAGMASNDDDYSFYFGRAYAGSVGHADYAGFGHRDQKSTTGYAVLQSAAGDTLINAPTGKAVYFKNNNATAVANMGASGTTLNIISAGASDYDAFLVSDSGLLKYRTGAQVLADLSGDAGAAFDWNSQNLTSVGTIGCGTITTTGNLVLPANGVVGVTDGNPQIIFDNANNWLEITGKVAIGSATCSAVLHIAGTDTSILAYLKNTRTSGTNYGFDAEATGLGATSNIAGYFAVTGATNNYAIQIPAGYPAAGANNWVIHSASVAKSYLAGALSVGTTTQSAQLHVDQASTTAAMPVLVLDQGDTDAPSINFIGAEGAGAGYCINTTEFSDFTRMVMVEYNGTMAWVKLYSTPV